jgi:hypothetical protein
LIQSSERPELMQERGRNRASASTMSGKRTFYAALARSVLVQQLHEPDTRLFFQLMHAPNV